jgi:tight adherence protein C
VQGGLAILVQIAAFAAAFGAALYGERVLGSVLSVRRRLGDAAEVAAPGRTTVIKAQTINQPFLRWVASATASDGDKEALKLRRNLGLAGLNSPTAPIWYVIIRFSLAIGLPILLVLGAGFSGKPLTGLGATVFPVALCGLGLIAPKMFVDACISSRRTRMEREFPDALDLMVVCVEAGLGLESAFVRVAKEVQESHPRIAEEFGYMSDELGAGRGRADALRALADRVDVVAVKSFVALLIQTEALGVSIAQSLRTYSAEMRQTRYLKAEEKAMRIPVLMTLPLITCLMPVIIVALMLPPMIDVVRVIGPALNAHPGASH